MNNSDFLKFLDSKHLGPNIDDETMLSLIDEYEAMKATPDESNEPHSNENIIEGLKTMLFHVMSIPVSSEQSKRHQLEQKLNEDEFLNVYVDKKMRRYVTKYINDDVKAAIVYAYHLKTTMSE